MLNEERKEYMVGTTGRTTPQKIEIVQNQLTKPLDNLKLEEQLDHEESTMSYSNLVPQKLYGMIKILFEKYINGQKIP